MASWARRDDMADGVAQSAGIQQSLVTDAFYSTRFYWYSLYVRWCSHRMREGALVLTE